MKSFKLSCLAAAMVAAFAAAPAAAGGGNGAPSGAHYNLNIIGVDNPKNSTLTDSNRHTIFVDLGRNGQVRSNIWLTQGEFKVCDGNAFDAAFDCAGNALNKTGAVFQLPCNTGVNADPEFDCSTSPGFSTSYTVWARALGKPGGSADMTLCATETQDFDGDTVLEEFCNTGNNVVMLNRTKGKQTFQDVTSQLTLLQADIDGDTTLEKIALFASGFEDWVWYYDNRGLRLAQLRFYLD